MKKIFGLFFLLLFSKLILGVHYELKQKTAIYHQTSFDRSTTANVISLDDKAWKDLNGELLAGNINRINNEPATKLAASYIEFHYLLQPQNSVRALNDRRSIIHELINSVHKLDPLVNELSSYEDAFTHILAQKIIPTQKEQVSNLLFQGGITLAATAFNLPYVYRHLCGDWISIINHESNSLWLGGMSLLKVAGVIAGLYKTAQFEYDTCKKVYSTIHDYDQFIMQFAHATDVVRKIVAHIVENPVLACAFPDVVNFDLTVAENPELKEILNALEKRLRYKNSRWSVYYKYKDSVALYEGIQKFYDQFKWLYWSIARLDAYLAIVRLYNYRKDNNLPVTFVEFDDTANRPRFAFDNLVNPLIADSVKNDFELDGHAIFNGPSTAGKTAAIKSIAAGFIMGQSILLVFAKKAVISPVHTMITYFNVGDNIKENQSSFKAQTTTMKNLADMAQRSAKNARTLLLIDEPCTGVIAPIGETQVTQFLHDLVGQNGLSILMSTHYVQPTTLANQHEHVRNFQPEIQEKSDRFIRTFKIKNGVAEWWYHDQEKANKFVEQILSEQ